VVRLKGGDPFVFGRGGEEALALRVAGVSFEVVPGVTSAVAVPAYAGVPVTHRGLSTSFTVVTGHSRHAIDQDINWDAIAAVGGTVVILMGVAHRAEIAKRLMEAGLDRSTPVAAVRWGTRPGQTTQRITLADLAEVPMEPPVTIVIGAVARLDLAWYEARPLFGRRIVVTRPRHEAGALSGRLAELGADPVEVPSIRLLGPSDRGAGLRKAATALRQGHYQWVVFTSARAVTPLLAELPDARAFGESRIAAIGPGTAAELGRYFLLADLVPDQFVAEDLVDRFPEGDGRVLLPRAAVARDVLPRGLQAKGWTVDVVEAYRTEREAPSSLDLQAASTADAITFTSSSTVTSYLAVAGERSVPPIVACIGPVTASTARDAGLTVDIVAAEHTIDGLVGALVDRFTARD
jgi:uroporphyrinogen III methyltransferase/synthase